MLGSNVQRYCALQDSLATSTIQPKLKRSVIVHLTGRVIIEPTSYYNQLDGEVKFEQFRPKYYDKDVSTEGYNQFIEIASRLNAAERGDDHIANFKKESDAVEDQRIKDALAIYLFARMTSYAQTYYILKYNKRLNIPNNIRRRWKIKLCEVYSEIIVPMLDERLSDLTLKQQCVLLKAYGDAEFAYQDIEAESFKHYHTMLTNVMDALKEDASQFDLSDLTYFTNGFSSYRFLHEITPEFLEVLMQRWKEVRDGGHFVLNNDFAISFAELQYQEINRRRGFKKQAGSFV